MQRGLASVRVFSHRAAALAGAQPALPKDLASVTHRPPGPEHPRYCSAGTRLQRALCCAADKLGEVPAVCLGAARSSREQELFLL